MTDYGAQWHDVAYRVYYEDTDAGGIVYHANYLQFCERARTEMMRALGYENRKLHEDTGILIIVRALSASYSKPAYLDDLLNVVSTVRTMKNSSFVMQQDILRDNRLIFSMEITLVCIDPEGKPVKLPDTLRKALIQFG
jgi:acyl-CoA thioester hydrolase